MYWRLSWGIKSSCHSRNKKIFKILQPCFKKLTVLVALQSHCNAHSKAVLDDSLITADTTSLDQHNLYYCTISHSPHEISGDVITSGTCHNTGSRVTRRKKNKKTKIGFEPISSKFGTPEAEKITLFQAIIFQLFSSYPPLGRVL